MKLNIDQTLSFLDKKQIDSKKKEAISQLQKLKLKTGQGSEFLAWLDWPEKISEQEITQINAIASSWKHYETVVVVGIGGSYLGAKAITELLSGYFKKTNDAPELIFAGHQLDENYLSELLSYLDSRNYAVVMISKSGTTLEPALTFRLLLQSLLKRYPKEAIKDRVIAITDAQKGVLRRLVEQYDLNSFVVPDDIGGRYSVLTAVGLLPIAIAGWNIQELLNGAQKQQKSLQKESENNIAITYASIRNLLYEKGYSTEVLAYSVQKFQYFSEWWKQLFGESEGKEQKGIFPTSLNYTTDLHSLGQYMQEGKRNIFETFLQVEQAQTTLKVPFSEDNKDGLNYLSGKLVHYINSKAEEGTIKAHHSGAVPVLQIIINDLSIQTIGELIYFFEISCAISAYMLDVNPFNQPGVEAYKRNMFHLLEKK